MAQIPSVVSGGIIESAWGNAIRDQTVQVFATKAERDAAIPSGTGGQFCWVSATPNVHYWWRDATGWKGFATFKGTKLHDGFWMSITPADFGLTNILYGDGTVDWMGQTGAAINLSSAKVTANVMQIRPYATGGAAATLTLSVPPAGGSFPVTAWAVGT